jgi:exopolysaccharide biosynthesis polyprenyl glycosylphosphotransferase
MFQQGSSVFEKTMFLKDAIVGERKFYQPIVQDVRFNTNGHNGHALLEKNSIKRESLENILSITAIVGDLTIVALGFVLAIIFRFQSILVPSYDQEGIPPLTISNSYKLILLASLIVIWGLVRRDLYSYKYLLHPFKAFPKFSAALAICLFTFIGISMAFHTVPPISRRLIVGALSLNFLGIYGWRLLLSRIMSIPSLAACLRKRLVVIGSGAQMARIQRDLGANQDFQFVGWVEVVQPNQNTNLEKFRLGPLYELRRILRNNEVDVAILTESESLEREGVLAVASVCESEHVQFRMVPHFFEILVSGLRPDTVGGIQVLGVEALPLNGYRNRSIKRMIDIVGSIVGLIISVPLIAIFGGLVYLESPGPIFYTQTRMGRNGRLFKMIKIRSMRLNAETHGKAQWAIEDDNRRLRIGAFIRKWNIDEVPQFWNVLKGDMSLVGPRPERPELIDRFKSEVSHYQVRHTCHPGMTGWAQVNGWRGNTDLEERIRYDIWYIESWNLLLDARIMFLTFFRRENAY